MPSLRSLPTLQARHTRGEGTAVTYDCKWGPSPLAGNATWALLRREKSEQNPVTCALWEMIQTTETAVANFGVLPGGQPALSMNC